MQIAVSVSRCADLPLVVCRPARRRAEWCRTVGCQQSLNDLIKSAGSVYQKHLDQAQAILNMQRGLAAGFPKPRCAPSRPL